MRCSAAAVCWPTLEDQPQKQLLVEHDPVDAAALRHGDQLHLSEEQALRHGGGGRPVVRLDDVGDKISVRWLVPSQAAQQPPLDVRDPVASLLL